MFSTRLLTPLLVSAGLLAACEQPEFTPETNTAKTFRPSKPGSNMMLRAPLTVADGLEVIISDVIIPAGGTVPLHAHPGEEFLYVIEGSAIHREEGQDDRMLQAGDSYVISPNAPHSPVGGPDGARAIVFRVHKTGEPERKLIETPDE